jgi:hypothetical protein
MIQGILVGKLRLISFIVLRHFVRPILTLSIVVLCIVGTLFWDANEFAVVSILFQSMLTTAIGSMLVVVNQFPLRSVFYKQQDANFYPTWTYIIGRSVASIPSAIIDSLLYGTIVYFFAGLAYNDGASVVNYIVFVASLFVMALTSGLFFSVYSAVLADIATAQAMMAVSVIVFVIFSGFIVQPDVIPE